MSASTTVERKRGGRPPIGKPFRTRLYPEQKALLEEMADCFGLDQADIVRAALDRELERLRRQAIRVLDRQLTDWERAA